MLGQAWGQTPGSQNLAGRSVCGILTREKGPKVHDMKSRPKDPACIFNGDVLKSF